MIEANVKFEFDHYEIIADGEVHSPADIRSLELSFIGMSKREVKMIDNDTMEIIKEVAMEELRDSVYNEEVFFNV